MSMKEKAHIMDKNAMQRTLMRMAHEILEKNKGIKDLAIVGVRTRGASPENPTRFFIRWPALR
jgi:pyrimidine operon attenuation protein/uracil phosphoribosyltransferase